jgi:hypothetical protein
MNFIEAINLINTNTAKSVGRFDWLKSKNISSHEFYKVLVLKHDVDYLPISYTPSIEDIMANDWIIREGI